MADWGIPCTLVYYDIHYDIDPSTSIGLNSLDINFIGFGNVHTLGHPQPLTLLTGYANVECEGEKLHIKAQIFAQHFPKHRHRRRR